MWGKIEFTGSPQSLSGGRGGTNGREVHRVCEPASVSAAISISSGGANAWVLPALTPARGQWGKDREREGSGEKKKEKNFKRTARDRRHGPEPKGEHERAKGPATLWNLLVPIPSVGAGGTRSTRGEGKGVSVKAPKPSKIHFPAPWGNKEERQPQKVGGGGEKQRGDPSKARGFFESRSALQM